MLSGSGEGRQVAQYYAGLRDGYPRTHTEKSGQKNLSGLHVEHLHLWAVK